MLGILGFRTYRGSVVDNEGRESLLFLPNLARSVKRWWYKSPQIPQSVIFAWLCVVIITLDSDCRKTSSSAWKSNTPWACTRMPKFAKIGEGMADLDCESGSTCMLLPHRHLLLLLSQNADIHLWRGDGGLKIFNGSRVVTTPISRTLVICRLGLAMFNSHTKVEVSVDALDLLATGDTMVMSILAKILQNEHQGLLIVAFHIFLVGGHR